MSGIHMMLAGGGETLGIQSLTFNGSAYGATGDSMRLRFNSDGTWDVTLTNAGFTQNGPTSGNWYSPTTTAIGNSYWIRITKTADLSISPGSASSIGSWVQLNIQRSVVVDSGGIADGEANYTVELSTSSTGTPVVASATTTLAITGA